MRYITVGLVPGEATQREAIQGKMKKEEIFQGALSVKQFLKDNGYTEHQIRHVKYVQNGLLKNGRPCRTVDPLQPGDTVEILIEDAVHGEIPWPVLYEDDDVLVINKPAGLVVHPAHGHYEDSLAGILQGTVRIIGRLDQDTSGVLMLAKNAIAAQRLQKQRWEGRLERTYLAWVHGEPSPLHGIIDKPMGQEDPNQNRMTTEKQRYQDENLLPAVTHYEVVATNGVLSKVKLVIETGRTHQIRVHMASTGHPIVGDPIYGNGPEFGIVRTALHAWELRWEQPHSGEVRRVRAEVPDELRGFV